MFGPDFYPTPRNIAIKMLAKIDKDAVNFLEPSAGRGDLAAAIAGDREDNYNRYGNNRRKVDCIEADPNLAGILRDKEFSVVGYDWLTYTGVCYYDAIVMNPPFSNGDEHLIRAWEFLHDGEIVCLLNEETIKNPHTERRQQLAAIIRDHGEVEYLGPVFKGADRATLVNVAMVYLKKSADDDRADLWAKNPGKEKAIDPDINATAEDYMLAVRDQLGNMEHFYNMANEHMLKAFEHVRKAAVYLEANGISEHGSGDYEKMPGMALRNVNPARAEFARKHRRDAWYQVFRMMNFHKWLDKKQTEQFLRDVEKEGNIPFTAANIKGTLENIFLQRKRLFEQSVANVFDSLTSYYKGNTTGTGGGGDYRGWKSNSRFKVNRKLVFPYGCSYEKDWGFRLYHGNGAAIDIYNDLDRVLCVLAGRDFETTLTVGRALEEYFRAHGYGKQVPGACPTLYSQFFEVRFFKKGTVHLAWKDERLWADFNKTAAAGKKWLGQDDNGDPEPPPDPCESAQEEEPEETEDDPEEVPESTSTALECIPARAEAGQGYLFPPLGA